MESPSNFEISCLKNFIKEIVRNVRDDTSNIDVLVQYMEETYKFEYKFEPVSNTQGFLSYGKLKFETEEDMLIFLMKFG